MKKIVLMLLVMVVFGNVFSYVDGSFTVSTIQSSSTPSFHSLHLDGVKGTTIFIDISGKCNGRSGEDLSGTVFLVLDDNIPASLKKEWYAMLLTAKNLGKSIYFHGNKIGSKASGRNVIIPYFMSLS